MFHLLQTIFKYSNLVHDVMPKSIFLQRIFSMIDDSLILSPRLKDSTLCPITRNKDYSPSRGDYIGDMTPSYLDSAIHGRSRILKIKKHLSQTIHPSLLPQGHSLLSSFQDDIPQAATSFVNKATHLISTLEAQNSKLKKSIKSFEIALKEQTNIYQIAQSRLKTLENSKPSQQIKKMQDQIRELTYKNLRIQAQFDNFVKKAQQPQQTMKPLSPPRDHDIKITKLQNQCAQLKDDKQTGLFLIATLKNEVSNLNQEISLLKQQIQENRKRIQQCSSFRDQNESIKRYRQLFFMCRQQKQSLEVNSRIDVGRLRKAQANVRKLRQKLLSFSSLIGKATFQIFQNQQKQFLDRLRLSLQQQQGFRRVCMSNLKIPQRYDVFQQTYNSAYNQNFVLEDHRLYLPSIFCLYDEGIKEFQSDLKMSFSKPIIPQLFLKLRAIFDSKFNEYLVCSEFTKFPDFVYSFLETFEVCPKLKKILEIGQRKTETFLHRRKFLCCLFHPKIEHHNQVVVFRQFLLGHCKQDEIFFYLSCRNLLLNGPQLQNYITASDTAVFLPYDDVSRCLNQLLRKYNSNVQNIVIYNINQKKKKKGDRFYIEIGYLLRALLEIYRASRASKLQKLNQIFNQIQQTSSKNQIRFAWFRELLQLNFSKLPLSRITYLYRECQALYRENKDFFACFEAVASQTIFITQLRQEFQEVRQSTTKSNFVLINSIDVAPLGLETLMCQYRNLLKESATPYGTLQQCMFLDRVLLGLAMRKQSNKEQYLEKIAQLLTSWQKAIEEKAKDLWAMTKLRQNKDNEIQQAGMKLTKIFGDVVRNYYTKFVDNINDRLKFI